MNKEQLTTVFHLIASKDLELQSMGLKYLEQDEYFSTLDWDWINKQNPKAFSESFTRRWLLLGIYDQIKKAKE